MFEFLTAVFNKVVWFVAAAMMAVGLGSSPVVLEPPADDSAAVPAIAGEVDKKKPQTAQVVDIFSEPAPEPESKPAYVSPPAPEPSSPPQPATFILPSGVVVDKYGNPVSSPESASAPANTSTAASSPANSSLPAGWFQLPSGKYTDPAGNIYDTLPQSIPNAVTGTVILPEGWTQMLSGAFKDPSGNIHFSLPDN